MIAAWALAALAGPLELRIPFPTEPIFDGAQQICVDVDVDLGVPPIEVDDGRFTVSCFSEQGHTEACIAVSNPERWPTRMPSLVCPGSVRNLVVTPILAFDPTEDISDGVEILRRLTMVQVAFRVPDLQDRTGILPGGTCGVTDGFLWMNLHSEPRRQQCTLIAPDGGEQLVPIALVNRLRR